MEDALIQALIDTATSQAQLFTGRAILQGSWESKMDYFPSKVTLDVIPIDPESIVVKYFDSDNVEQTLSNTEYFVSSPDDEFPVIEFTGSIPSTYNRRNAVTIQYDAGYTDVPPSIKTAILMQVATMYENRQDEVVGSSSALINLGSRHLLFPYKML